MKITVGMINKKFPRFFIFDEENGLFWTGSNWNTSIKKAMLFCDEKGFTEEYERVINQHFGNDPVQTFEVKVVVEVRGKSLNWAELVEYLKKDIKFRQNGTGPKSESAVRLILPWAEIKLQQS